MVEPQEKKGNKRVFEEILSLKSSADKQIIDRTASLDLEEIEESEKRMAAFGSLEAEINSELEHVNLRLNALKLKVKENLHTNCNQAGLLT